MLQNLQEYSKQYSHKIVTPPQKENQNQDSPTKKVFHFTACWSQQSGFASCARDPEPVCFPQINIQFEFPTIGYSIGISKLFTFWNNIKSF